MSRLKKYWYSLSLRDQRVLGIGAFTVLCIMLYSLIWSPMQDTLKSLRPQVISRSADLAWMRQQAVLIQTLTNSSAAKKGVNKQPLLTVVDQTAKAQKIRGQIKQIQPGKETGTAKIWFEKVIFEDWLRWMDRVSVKGISVTRASITKSADSPKVNIRLELLQK